MELDEHGLQQADSDPMSTLISRMVLGMTVLFVGVCRVPSGTRLEFGMAYPG